MIKETVILGSIVVNEIRSLFDNAQKNTENSSGGAGKVTQGKSRAPSKSEPGSVYEQVDDYGNVRSRTQYNGSSRGGIRDDFDHQHYDKVTSQYLQPHRHVYEHNSNGQVIRQSVIPIQ